MGERTDEMNYGHDRDLRSDQRSSDELRRDVERTQQEITRTLRQIEDRISPRNVMDRAGDAIKSAPRRTSRKLVDRIKENPIPAALAGVGLFLLFRGSDEGNTEYDRAGAGYNYSRGRYDTLDRYGYDRGYDTRGRMWEEADDRGAIREKLSDVGENISDAATTMKDKTADLVDDARERTSEFVDEASERLQEVGDRARYQARRAQYEFQDAMNENPLVIGLAGVALGAIIGLSVPETRKENEMLGPVRDRLADRAADVAQEKIEKAQHVAEAATDAAANAAKREADRQGLTSDLQGSAADTNRSQLPPSPSSGYRASEPPRSGSLGSNRPLGSDLGTPASPAPGTRTPGQVSSTNPKTPGSDPGRRGGR